MWYGAKAGAEPNPLPRLPRLDCDEGFCSPLGRWHHRRVVLWPRVPRTEWNLGSMERDAGPRNDPDGSDRSRQGCVGKNGSPSPLLEGLWRVLNLAVFHCHAGCDSVDCYCCFGDCCCPFRTECVAGFRPSFDSGSDEFRAILVASYCTGNRSNHSRV